MTDAGPRPDWAPASLFPCQPRFLEVGGARVHYVDEGSGPVILMLHGNPTWSFLYRKVIAGLEGQFRCVALDYPGFGLSSAPPDYGLRSEEHALVGESFVKALDLTDMVLMAHDWGGPIGMAVAGRNPERFKGFALGNPMAWPVDKLPRVRFFSKLMGGLVGAFLIYNFNGFVTLMMPMATKRIKYSPEVKAAYRGPFPTRASRAPTHVFPEQILGATPFLREVAANLEKLAGLPMLLTWPDSDLAFDASFLARWRERFPAAAVVPLEGCGHYIYEEAPDEIAAAVKSWYAETFG